MNKILHQRQFDQSWSRIHKALRQLNSTQLKSYYSADTFFFFVGGNWNCFIFIFMTHLRTQLNFFLWRKLKLLQLLTYFPHSFFSWKKKDGGELLPWKIKISPDT